jgi:uncharacterized Ntn-hydrolase superfamily protein
MTSTRPTALFFIFLISITDSLRATYSIVACDSTSGQCGVAVQTENLAVGASVPYAQAGVGAVASQFETNPHYGPRGLAFLAAGNSPADALRKILEEDGQFDDGNGVEARQVALVSVDGRTAVHTGAEAAQAEWAGSRSGVGYSIQGNGLAGPQVLSSMETAFITTPGTLSERLLAALAAGDKAGGQRTGRESAALLVRTREGYPYDIDLRVDDAPDPVGELRRIYGLQAARQQVIQARIDGNHGRIDEARSLLIAAVAHSATWPRGCCNAAEVAASIDEPELSMQYLELAYSRSPTRINSVIGDGDFAILGSYPAFHRWVDSDILEKATESQRKFNTSKIGSIEDRLNVAAILLEVGKPADALNLIDHAAPAELSTRRSLLRATALAALGKPEDAIAECRNALKRDTGDVHARLWLAHLLSTSVEKGANPS